MSTRKRSWERVIDARLGRAADNIDDLVAGVRVGRQSVSDGLARRVDALRAREAQVRAQVREMRRDGAAARKARSADLHRQLDELDTAIASGIARLAIELAIDEAEFADAVRTELEAWTIHLERLSATAVASPGGHAQLQTAIGSISEQLRATHRTLEHFREAPPSALPTARADVIMAIEDLDRSIEGNTPCGSTRLSSE